MVARTYEVHIRKEGSKKMTDLNMKTAGIDTGKDELQVCLLPDKELFKVKNDAAGIAELVRRCLAAGIVRAAIEATSVYHLKAARALSEAGIETCVVQPRQARHFAQALLKWDKSDEIDASVLARLAQVLDKPAPLAEAKIEALAEIMTFIEHYEERIAWIKTTLERYENQRIRAVLEADIKALQKRRKAELVKLEAGLRKDAELDTRFDLLLSIPGVAERTALGLLIRMPELGAMTRGQAAKLAGLAPQLSDSAKHNGERHIYGGRARVRKTAFLAAFASAMQWNPDLKEVYQRLRKNGKAHTSAVTACARKLIHLANAILARGTPWTDRSVMP
jgi:transposase